MSHQIWLLNPILNISEFKVFVFMFRFALLLEIRIQIRSIDPYCNNFVTVICLCRGPKIQFNQLPKDSPMTEESPVAQHRHSSSFSILANLRGVKVWTGKMEYGWEVEWGCYFQLFPGCHLAAGIILSSPNKAPGYDQRCKMT